jgi:hypothetical protein
MNGFLAGKIGRPDLAGIPVDPYGGSSGIAQQGALGPYGISANAAIDGRLTAGVLMVGLFVVAGFYVWTRGVQA